MQQAMDSVRHGMSTPNGTILGPLLFLLYVNDIPNCLSNSQSRMYADDTHLTYADIGSIEASLNQDLSNINRWLIANKLTQHDKN